MTTETSPFASYNFADRSTTNSWAPSDQTDTEQHPFPEQRDHWQIVPPIVTTGRLAAVKVPQTTQEQRNQAAPSDQESTTLFQVSFTGLDQQRYRVSATAKPTANGRWQPVSYAQEQTFSSPPLYTPEPLPSLRDEQTKSKEEADKNFLLQIIQPGLVGLMDGSVSTLAPIFAVAFATHQPFTTFLVGMASALGAGISMAFSEALSDDGDLTGRGNPFLRGGVTGLMTFLSGAGHALPFLIPHLQLALFVAYAVVVLELIGIAAIRHKFFGTNWWLSMVQVVGGGALVFIAALLLGSA